MILDLSDVQSRKQIRLLVADEEHPIRLALSRALSLIGYQVEEAASSQEALALLAQHCYDLMIMDITFADMGGVEALQLMRKKYPDVMIIILTGNPSMESAIEAVRSNVSDYLLKPTCTNEIINVLTSALQSKAAQKQKEYLIDVLDRLHHKKTLSGNGEYVDLQTNRPVLIVPPLHLNQKDASVIITNNSRDKIVALTKGETAVLASMMLYPGKTLNCATIVQYAWHYDMHEAEARNMIRPYIFRIRKKIEHDPKKPDLIITVRNQGYYLATTSNNTPANK